MGIGVDEDERIDERGEAGGDGCARLREQSPFFVGQAGHIPEAAPERGFADEAVCIEAVAGEAVWRCPA